MIFHLLNEWEVYLLFFYYKHEKFISSKSGGFRQSLQIEMRSVLAVSDINWTFDWKKKKKKQISFLKQ